MRLVNVEGAKPRILYIEGEPRWEFKFIRRAVRTTAAWSWTPCCEPRRTNFTSRLFANTKRAGGSFPTKPEELFKFSGLIIGDVESELFQRRAAGIDPRVANRGAAAFCSWAAAPRCRWRLSAFAVAELVP